jgi:uncharacterized OB-fold protein
VTKATELPPLPNVEDPRLSEYWSAVRQGVLRIPYCMTCGAAQWPPRPSCQRCHGLELEWRETEPAGVIYTFFVSYRAFHPGFGLDLPYAVAAVELHPGIRMLGRVVGVAAEEVRIGMPVRARFHVVTSQVTLVYWEPA